MGGLIKAVIWRCHFGFLEIAICSVHDFNFTIQKLSWHFKKHFIAQFNKRKTTHLVDPWSQSAQDHQYPAFSAAAQQIPGWIEESQGMCYPKMRMFTMFISNKKTIMIVQLSLKQTNNLHISLL